MEACREQRIVIMIIWEDTSYCSISFSKYIISKHCRRLLSCLRILIDWKRMDVDDFFYAWLGQDRHVSNMSTKEFDRPALQPSDFSLMCFSFALDMPKTLHLLMYPYAENGCLLLCFIAAISMVFFSWQKSTIIAWRIFMLSKAWIFW